MVNLRPGDLARPGCVLFSQQFEIFLQYLAFSLDRPHSRIVVFRSYLTPRAFVKRVRMVRGYQATLARPARWPGNAVRSFPPWAPRTMLCAAARYTPVPS